MKQKLLILMLLTATIASSQTRQPFKNIGQKTTVITLSNGKYDEFFDEDSLQRLGSAVININTHKLTKIKFSQEEIDELENARASRFLSVDPLTGKYPELTPYQYASNRPIDGIDLDGLEYYSAANWAQKNIANYTIKFTNSYQDPPTFKSLRQPNWKELIGKTMYCATSTALSYAQASPKVAQALQNTGFKTNRSFQMEYFQKGSEFAHLIKPQNSEKADRGDLLFLQNPDKPSQTGQGHVAILATSTRSQGEGSFTVNVYSTNAGNSNDPDRVGTFGEAIYLFQTNNKGETQLVTKYWYDIDNKVFRSQDMRDENLILQGFGRVDEKKIKKEDKSKSNSDASSEKSN